LQVKTQTVTINVKCVGGAVVSENYEQYKLDFIKKNLSVKERISISEYNMLDEKDRLVVTCLKESDNEYYRIDAAKINDAELNNYILMNLLDNSKSMTDKLNIVIVWLVIIGAFTFFTFLSVFLRL
jgi:hypothetical protein